MTHTKANKSKNFALFFNLIMYLVLILGIVFASPPNTVYAEGGTGATGGLTIGGETSSYGDGYVYDGATQTLTLQNYNGKEIYFYGDVIQLEGNNTITVDKTSEKFPFPNNSAYNCYSAIYSRGAITITGSGSLAVNMETSDVDESCYGIYAKEGMTINGGNIAININSYYGGAGYGLYSNNGSVIIGGSASLDLTTKSNAIETIGNDIVISGTGVGAGTYTATLKLNKGFKWTDGTTAPKTVTWEIARVPDVEIEVTLTQTEYPYTGFDISAYFKITAKGTGIQIDKSECDIIYTNNKEVGEATVVIKDNGKGNYAITNTVTKNFTIVKCTTGEPTGLTGIAPSEEDATDGKITGTTADMEYSTDTAFTSPKPCMDGETTGFAEGTYYVRYKATATTEASNYVAVHVRLNTVTVVDGDGSKVTKHKSGTSVTVTVTIPTGKSFIKWVYEGVTIPTEDVTKQEITFTMPEKDVKLTALFEDIIYNIMITNGTPSAATAKYEKEITVTANAPATGKEFDKWVVTGITLPDEDLAKSTVTFEMPASNVTMEATYKDVVYKVTVKDATATPEMATYQTEVTVTANEPDTDMYFDKWEVTGLDTTGMDLTKTEIKFQMPAGNVTFKATYLTIVKYEIYVVDGTKDKSPAKAGETIIITANPAKEGKVFDKWTCETAGVTIEFESATSSKTTFVMPACEITIQAHFRNKEVAPSIEIKVNGGTGAGAYKEGESVTITANDPAEGKVFTGWQDASGKIVSTEKSYTFNVTEERTLTAVYDDMPSGGGEITPPAKKKGLSGGQIAGIVIGSVAVAGIIGFAVLWFAVKKKTFADLGVALKKGFTAIGNFFKNLGVKIKSLFTKKK